jgi:type II secretory pathway pseudopilin PulG
MGLIVVLVVVAVSAVVAVLVLRWGDRQLARKQAAEEAARARRRKGDQPAAPTQAR